MKKFEVGDLVKISDGYSKWLNEVADDIYSVGGNLKLKTYEDILDYGLNRFSYQNALDIFCIIEGDNGYSCEDFAYRVYCFNQLGFGFQYVSSHDLEKL
jgi:hypothetical protein